MRNDTNEAHQVGIRGRSKSTQLRPDPAANITTLWLTPSWQIYHYSPRVGSPRCINTAYPEA